MDLFEGLVTDVVIKSTEGRGGARVGAGRKPRGYVKPVEASEFEKSKARKEAALADMHELNFKIKSGEYIPRAPVREASATMLASLAQTLRSIPDNLERKLNLAPDIAEAVEREIDSALSDISDDMAKFTTEQAESE